MERVGSGKLRGERVNRSMSRDAGRRKQTRERRGERKRERREGGKGGKNAKFSLKKGGGASTKGEEKGGKRKGDKVSSSSSGGLILSPLTRLKKDPQAPLSPTPQTPTSPTSSSSSKKLPQLLSPTKKNTKKKRPSGHHLPLLLPSTPFSFSSPSSPASSSPTSPASPPISLDRGPNCPGKVGKAIVQKEWVAGGGGGKKGGRKRMRMVVEKGVLCLLREGGGGGGGETGTEGLPKYVLLLALCRVEKSMFFVLFCFCFFVLLFFCFFVFVFFVLFFSLSLCFSHLFLALQKKQNRHHLLFNHQNFLFGSGLVLQKRLSFGSKLFLRIFGNLS